jgi:two-component system, NtrC family, sensor kinase
MQTEKTQTPGDRAAGMAHRINNPLGTILQTVQNLQRRLSPGLAANERIAAEVGLDFDALQRYLKQRSIFELLEMVEASGSRIAGIVAGEAAESGKQCGSEHGEDTPVAS